MPSVFQQARRRAQQITIAIVSLQVAAMLGLTVTEAFRRRRHAVTSFPTIAPEGLTLDGDELRVYTYGADLYEAMLHAIDSAQERIFFETFIWKDDEWGQRFKEAFLRAAQRGVEVHLCWDAFANTVVPRKFWRFPRLPNLHLLKFPAVTSKHWGCNHRKLLIVDGTVGFIGGYNIGSLYATHWRDTHLEVRGPSAAELENAAIDFWNLHRRRGHRVVQHDPVRSWFGRVRLHRNTPSLSVYPIRNMYLEAIDRATTRIWLTHAYLIPDDNFVFALELAVKRGVDVRIIVPYRSNHVVADWLSRGTYSRLLRGGVRLFLYQDAMVHAKTATVDGAWSTIGTANLDRLSLAGNYEVNLEILDTQLASTMEEVFRMDEANCVELTLDQWRRRSLLTKGTEVLLRPWRWFF